MSSIDSSHNPLTTSPLPWAPPKAPLPPHKLAKLANALGISTPMPAVHHSTLPSPLSSTYTQSHVAQIASTSSLPDQLRRSPTPLSTMSFTSAPTLTTSKFLLHVIPPVHLPHDSDSTDDLDFLPPPYNASGYHSHFRRGILVPVHSNLQSQLASIAREYALPSTAGLVLYLILPDPSPTSEDGTPFEFRNEEPGPRISEDIWRHIWTRIVKAERDDAPARSPSPLTLGRGGLGQSIGAAMASSPSLLTDPHRPLMFHNKTTPAPTPSTPSTPSDYRIHTNTSSLSQSMSIKYSSEPETPDTSLHSGSRSGSFDLPLPGLKSPALIPILAKVEFDVDKGKAGWYEPWCRSRRNNRSNKGGKCAGRKGSGNESLYEDNRPAPFDLQLVKMMQSPVPFIREMAARADHSDSEELGYQRLDNSTNDDDDDEADDDEEENNTARILSIPGAQSRDPLADIFGSDGEAWADLRHESRTSSGSKLRSSSIPNIVNLALTAEELIELPSESDIDRTGVSEDSGEEVKEILRRVSETSRKSSGSLSRSSSTRKKPPPSITIESIPSLSPFGDLPHKSADNTKLPYLQPSAGDSGEDSQESASEISRPKTVDTDKRTGGVYDDFDLGLDELDDDPEDRRKSQFLMRAALDRIEQNLAQFSPQPLQVGMEEEQSTSVGSHRRGKSSGVSPRYNADMCPPTSQLSSHPEIALNSPPRAAWPAVPYSSIVNTESHEETSIPAPPQLALNGVTTAAPRAYMEHSPTHQSDIESESAMRKREMDTLEAYSRPRPSQPRSTPNLNTRNWTPIIPLSPDPFGRFSSSVYEAETFPDQNRRNSASQSLTYWDSVPVGIPPAPSGDDAEGIHGQQPKSQTSRFSADSLSSETGISVSKPKNSSSASLNAMKSIKKLWRKSNKNSVSSTNNDPMPDLPAPPPKEKEVLPRASKETGSRTLKESAPRNSKDLPRSSKDSPAPPRENASAPVTRFSIGLPSPSASQVHTPQPTGTQPPQVAMMKKTTPSLVPPTLAQHGFEGLRFNQETPYPIPRRAPTPAASSLPPPPLSPVIETMADQQQEPPTNRPRSILKLRKGPFSSPRSSISDSSPASGHRPRRPSVLGGVSSRSSYTSVDIPPSPALPEHFFTTTPQLPPVVAPLRISSRSMSSDSTESNGSSALYHQQSIVAKSRRPSVSSKTSEESRPSFDASQFEIVSPKMVNSTLVYPYHTLDH